MKLVKEFHPEIYAALKQVGYTEDFCKSVSNLIVERDKFYSGRPVIVSREIVVSREANSDTGQARYQGPIF